MDKNQLAAHRGERIHFIGIGGSSMRGLARLVRGQGYEISGSDRVASHATEALTALGVPVTIGHFDGNVHGAGFIVYTAAISKDNPELLEAERLKIPTIERAELLGQLSSHFSRSVSVCGTHGKTTATSMLAVILADSGLDPTIHIGGELDYIGGSVRSGKGDLFLTEACEFQESFLTLHPSLVLLLNIDADHLDYYKDIFHIESAFLKFLSQVRENGTVVLCADNARALAMRGRVACKTLSYGLDAPADYAAADLEPDETLCYSVTALEGGKPLGRVRLRVPGRLNALNALGAIASARVLGLSMDEIAPALEKFGGAHRRFEHTGDVEGVTLYHDYGHNPEEFRSVVPLAAARAKGKLYVVCQPHTYSRTKALFSDYLTAFDGADEVLVTDIYAAREKDPGDIHSRQLVDAMQKKGVPAVYTKDFDGTEGYLRAHWQPGDFVITLGCGNINLLNEQIQKHGSAALTIREAKAEDLNALLALYVHLHESAVPASSPGLSALWAQILSDPNH
ncbi:MAG: UDP-N-acetylmuramate--L-alanine ligase, partial [Christensenellaceae bacterium]|nr:UDP-N-acetylmuramate--L-alanine ligase [Christensenellaceae bacterium]